MNPYSEATADNILAFLVSNDRLHEVIALFIEAQPGTYNTWRAEQLLIDYMPVSMANNLIAKYIDQVDIEDEYNEWWYLYHLDTNVV